MDRIKVLKNQILKFGTVGLFAFIIDYFILFFLTEFYEVYYFISNAVAYSISTIFNYFISMMWVFKAKESLSKRNQFIIFVTLSLAGLVINQIVIYISVEKINLYYLIGKLLAIIIVMIWNFITKKLALEEH